MHKIKIELRNRTNLFYALGLSDLHLEGRSYVRAIVRIRDGFTCVKCDDFKPPFAVTKANKKIKGLRGRIKLHDIHHLKGLCGSKSRGIDKITDLALLVNVCHRCHYTLHSEASKPQGGHRKIFSRTKAIQLRGAGLAYDAIAKKLGVSQPAIWKALNK